MTSSDPRSGSAATPGFVIANLLGGDGRLLAAQQLGLDRVVAIKRLDEALAGDPQARARFRAEVSLVGMLEHPGIVPLYQAGEDAAGVPFYALRQVRGQAWSLRLERAAGGREDELDVLERVAESLAFAHDRGIAHGDLSAAAVILGEHGEVLLTGWHAATQDSATQAVDAARLAALLQRIWPGVPVPVAATAGEFLAGLRDLRHSAVARGLLDRARAHLETARRDGNIEQWARARFACAEAFRLAKLPDAAALARDIALGHAAQAEAHGDLALALAVLERGDPAQAVEAGRLATALARRGRRQTVLRRLVVAAALLAALLGTMLTVTAVRSEHGRRQARTAEAEAVVQRAAAAADAYASALAAAADHLAGGRPDLAQPLLEACATAQRHWEWSRLQYLQAQRMPEFDQDGAGSPRPVAVDGGWIAAPCGATSIGLWRGPGRPERVIDHPVRPRAIALDPQGDRLVSVQGEELTCRATADGSILWTVRLAVQADCLLVLSDRRTVALQRSGRPGRWQSVDAAGGCSPVADLPAGARVAGRDGDGFLLACDRLEVSRIVRLSGVPGAPEQELKTRPNAALPAVLGGVRPRLGLVSYGNGRCGSATLDQPSPSVWLDEQQPLGIGAFSPDGRYIAGGSWNGLSLFIHERTSHRPPLRISPPEAVHHLIFTSDGSGLVLVGDSTLRLLPVVPIPPWREVAEALPPAQPCRTTAAGHELRFADGRAGDRRHPGVITAVAEAEGRVFSGDAAGWLMVWDAARACRLWAERIGEEPIEAIVPGQPLRVRSGGRVLALPDAH